LISDHKLSFLDNSLTVSFGLSEFNINQNVSHAISQADKKMLIAKQDSYKVSD
tara:strand:- start:151 stop:309 length:159 start_codon:yes stop_codon:yes gene_type:complete